MVGPALPARVRAGKRSSVPTSRNTTGNQPSAQPGTTTEITLEDGTKIPYKIPASMPPVQAQALVAYLQQNPEVAKKAHEQAQAMLKTPGMASAFLQGVQTPAAESAERFAFLKDDADLKHVFEDVQANGPEAVQKYWDDEELMVKINAKMKEHQLKQQQEAGVAPRPPPPITNLYDAAKQGDAEAATRYLDEGADINAKNDKGVTALGIAVGFNRKDVVALLVARGADIGMKDAKGNTVLHYAAGYGRKEVCEMLVAAGADLDVQNDAKQTPLDAAKMNKEKALVDTLKAAWKQASKSKALA